MTRDDPSRTRVVSTGCWSSYRRDRVLVSYGHRSSSSGTDGSTRTGGRQGPVTVGCPCPPRRQGGRTGGGPSEWTAEGPAGLILSASRRPSGPLVRSETFDFHPFPVTHGPGGGRTGPSYDGARGFVSRTLSLLGRTSTVASAGPMGECPCEWTPTTDGEVTPSTISHHHSSPTAGSPTPSNPTSSSWNSS